MVYYDTTMVKSTKTVFSCLQLDPKTALLWGGTFSLFVFVTSAFFRAILEPKFEPQILNKAYYHPHFVGRCQKSDPFFKTQKNSDSEKRAFFFFRVLAWKCFFYFLTRWGLVVVGFLDFGLFHRKNLSEQYGHVGVPKSKTPNLRFSPIPLIFGRYALLSYRPNKPPGPVFSPLKNDLFLGPFLETRVLEVG